MRSVNAHTITGNVGRAEIAFTPGGKKVLNFSVAVTKSQKDAATQEWKDLFTTWYAGTLWGDEATAFENLNKGDRVQVNFGHVELRQYETREGGHGASLEMRNINSFQIVPNTNTKANGNGNGNGDATAHADEIE